MHKKPMYLLMLGALATLAACSTTQGEASSDKASQSGNEGSSTYYLTGDLDLEGGKAELTKNGNNYTLSGLKLHRGDSFTILKGNSSAVSYENLTSKTGFVAGGNGYIRVLNEGIFNLTFEEGSAPKLTLAKTASSYSNVKLVTSNGKSENFTLNEDFTYTLNNVDLLYRENFYIALDDEKLSYGDFNYNDLYYSALRFQNDAVKVIQKGTFAFNLNFANEKALTVTSENLNDPVAIPTDATTYKALIDTFSDKFKANGKTLEVTQTDTDADGKATNKYYKESVELNEHYLWTKDGDSDTSVISERASLYNDTNCYDMTVYTNSTSSNSLTGFLLGEAPEKEKSDTSSTMVVVDKEYITEENAKKRITSFTGESNSLLSYLDYPLTVSHLSSSEHTSTYDAQYKEAVQITGDYKGDIGDSLELTAVNIEKYQPSSSYYKPKAIRNTVHLVTNNEGQLASGYILVEQYSGDGTFDDDGNISSSATLSSSRKYTFEYTYGEQTKVTNFKLDPAKYVLSDFALAGDLDIQNGDSIPSSQISFPIAESEPTSAIDTSKIQIIEYDSEYFTRGYDGSTFEAKKKGTTTVYLGNLYSNLRKALTINIDYKAPSSISISPYGYESATYYVGSTYEFEASVSPSTADQAITVTSSDESKVQVVDLPDADMQRTNKKATFKLKMLAAADAVTITIKTVGTPTVTKTFTIKVSSALTLADFANTYYYKYSSSSTYPTYKIVVEEDGNATISNSSNETTYSFKTKVDGESLVLDSSEKGDLTSFSATLGSIDVKEGEMSTLTISEAKASDGTDVRNTIYSSTYNKPTFISMWSMFAPFVNAKDEANNATMELGVYSMSNYQGITVAATIKVGSEMTIVLNISYASYNANNHYCSLGNAYYNGSSKSSTLSITTLNDQEFSFNVYATYDSTTYNYTFAFTPVSE